MILCVIFPKSNSSKIILSESQIVSIYVHQMCSGKIATSLITGQVLCTDKPVSVDVDDRGHLSARGKKDQNVLHPL